jgi:hypothetical protein
MIIQNLSSHRNKLLIEIFLFGYRLVISGGLEENLRTQVGREPQARH